MAELVSEHFWNTSSGISLSFISVHDSTGKKFGFPVELGRNSNTTVTKGEYRLEILIRSYYWNNCATLLNYIIKSHGV